MIEHSIFKLSNIRKLLVVFFSLIIILSVAIVINTEIIKLQPKNVQQSITDRFNKIKDQLEFNGITKTVIEMTEGYSKLFDGFSNIIITDDYGKILYKVNSGYISEGNKFSILIDPWLANGFGSDIAYLIDSKNKIKYSAQLDIGNNMNKLKEQSSKNTLSKVLFPKLQDSDDYLGDRELTNDDGSSYVVSQDTKIIMNYEYVASKGLNLYSLYDSDHQYHNYYIFTNYIKIVRHWLTVFIFVFIFLFWGLLPLWVFKDARKHHYSARKWATITLLINILGLGVYLIFRPKNEKCQSCNKTVEVDWILCPYCGNKINAVTATLHK